MRASQRYALTSGWSTIDKYVGGGPREEQAVTVTREVADIKDTVGGYEYRQGAYRVEAIETMTGKSYKRSKTFYGEMAWANSERMYHDIMWELKMKEPAW